MRWQIFFYSDSGLFHAEATKAHKALGQEAVALTVLSPGLALLQLYPAYLALVANSFGSSFLNLVDGMPLPAANI